jgi:hypothetical protein
MKAVGLITLSWWWCVAGFIVDFVAFWACIVGGYLFSKKVTKGIDFDFSEFGKRHIDATTLDEKLRAAKDRLG